MNIVKRGYVTVATGQNPGITKGHVSAVVSHKNALELQKRFGGITVNAAGLQFFTVRKGPVTFRVLTESAKQTVRHQAQAENS